MCKYDSVHGSTHSNRSVPFRTSACRHLRFSSGCRRRGGRGLPFGAEQLRKPACNSGARRAVAADPRPLAPDPAPAPRAARRAGPSWSPLSHVPRMPEPVHRGVRDTYDWTSVSLRGRSVSDLSRQLFPARYPCARRHDLRRACRAASPPTRTRPAATPTTVTHRQICIATLSPPPPPHTTCRIAAMHRAFHPVPSLTLPSTAPDLAFTALRTAPMRPTENERLRGARRPTRFRSRYLLPCSASGSSSGLRLLKWRRSALRRCMPCPRSPTPRWVRSGC